MAPDPPAPGDAASAAATSPGGDLPLRDRLPTALLERGRDRLTRARLLLRGPPNPLVFLLLAIDEAPARRWPWQQWVMLAQGLRRARPDLDLAVLTTPDELWPAVRVHEEVGRIVPVLGPDLDAAAIVAVLAHGTAAVGVDTAHLRLAASLGMPTVGVYGPTDPYLHPPRGDRHTAVFAARWCAPCGLRRCWLLHQRCLRELPAQPVLDAVLAQLPA